jgi:hypothetical protein
VLRSYHKHVDLVGGHISEYRVHFRYVLEKGGPLNMECDMGLRPGAHCELLIALRCAGI